MAGYLDILEEKPGKIICLGKNYPLVDTDSQERSRYPILFQKPSSGLIGPEENIIIPNVSSQVLYEGELALVLGRTARHVSERNVLDFLKGVVIANDLSAADIEARTSQWASGKMFDTFTPIGPRLAPLSDLKNILALDIETRLNGNLVQTGNTSQMIFNIEQIVCYISSLTTLEPGDLILTGSPKMCQNMPDPRIPLKVGDRIEISIEGIGTLVNHVAGEEMEYA